jgi:hypothetical protein
MNKLTSLVAAVVLCPAVLVFADTETIDCSGFTLNTNLFDMGNGYFLSAGSWGTMTIEQGKGSQAPKYADGKFTVYGGNSLVLQGKSVQLAELIGEASGWDASTTFSTRNGDIEAALVGNTIYFKSPAASTALSLYLPDDDGSDSHFDISTIRFTDVYTDPIPTGNGSETPDPGTETPDEPSAESYADEAAACNINISTLAANKDYYEFSPQVFIINNGHSITISQGSGSNIPTIKDGTLYIYAGNLVQTSFGTQMQRIRFAGITDWAVGATATLSEDGTAEFTDEGLVVTGKEKGWSLNVSMPADGGSVLKVKMLNVYETIETGDIDTPEETEDEPTAVVNISELTTGSELISAGGALYIFKGNDSFFFEKADGATSPAYSSGVITVYAGNRIGIQAQRARQRYKFIGKLTNWDETATFSEMASASARFEDGSLYVDGTEPLMTYNAYMPANASNGGESSFAISSIRVYEQIGGEQSALKNLISDGEVVAVDCRNLQVPAGAKVYNMRGAEVGTTSLPAGIYVVSTPNGNVKVCIK